MKTLHALRVGLVLFLVMALAAPLLSFADTWNEPIKDSKRFTVLSSFDNKAVRDNETGLVWELSPDTDSRNWFSAQGHRHIPERLDGSISLGPSASRC